MENNLLVLSLGVLSILLIIIIYNFLRKKIKIYFDYNRKITESDKEFKNELSVLRHQLLETDNPLIRNEILQKIETVIRGNKI